MPPAPSEKIEPIGPIEILWISTVRRVHSLFILGEHRKPDVQVSGLYWHSNHRAQSQSDTRAARWKYQGFVETAAERGKYSLAGNPLDDFTDVRHPEGRRYQG
jgi:hypothetical protein